MAPAGHRREHCQHYNGIYDWRTEEPELIPETVQRLEEDWRKETDCRQPNSNSERHPGHRRAYVATTPR